MLLQRPYQTRFSGISAYRIILQFGSSHAYSRDSYGSSWHAGDAGFIGFLGKYGYKLLLLGSSLVIIGFCYLVWVKRGYSLLSPRPTSRLLEPFELNNTSVLPDSSGRFIVISQH